MLQTSIRIVALAVVVAMLGWPGRASADSATGPGLDLGNNRIHWIKATNTTRNVTATVRLARVPSSGEAHFSIDTGFDDSASMYSFHGYGVLIDKRRGVAPRATFRRESSESPRALSCRGLRVAWDRSRAQIRLVLPQRCLGADQGPARVGFQGPDEVTHGTAVRTRVLQRGARGARYGDVNGDGRADRTRTRVAGDRYVVTVRLPGRQVRAGGPLSGSAPQPRPVVFSRLDIDKNGRAELFLAPNDELGDGGDAHLFTLVRGKLRPIVKTSGRRLELRHSFAGTDVYRDYRCSGRTLQTWRLVGGQGTDRYTVRVTTWKLRGARAVRRAGTTLRTSAKGLFTAGNWSGGSCLTR